MEEIVAEYEDEYVMRDDETLEQLLDRLRAQNEDTLRIFAEADLDTQVPVPHDVPWFPQDLDFWNVRWVALHLIEELTRHAGPRRHHPRIHRRRNDVRADGRRRGLAGDRLDQAVEGDGR